MASIVLLSAVDEGFAGEIDPVEDRRRATCALDFADQLRAWRKEIAHALEGAGQANDAEVEELLLIGGRCLEVLWRLTDSSAERLRPLDLLPVWRVR